MTDLERRWDEYAKKKHISLGFKFAVVIIAAAFLSFIAMVAVDALKVSVADKYFLSDDAKRGAINARYESLDNFIVKNGVSGHDSNSLQKWLEKKSYTMLVISDGSKVIFSGGFQSGTDSSIWTNQEDMPDSESKYKDLTKNKPDLYNRRVKFNDKKYNVYINVFLEGRWYAVMNTMEIVVMAIVFIVIIMLYVRWIMRRIGRLSDNVLLISEGDLHHEIEPGQKDELGDLAENVNTMRNSILEKTGSEQAAWNANKQLITSMSHDIRTPLTSLIGYLDIISGRKYNSQEELDRYIDSCRDKAVQLKDLSDKMFQYFLVFGNQEPERDLEILDAGILFQQLIVEHNVELMSKGYSVDFDYLIPEGTMIETDTSSLHRIFDNLFSNIMKYADKDYTVETSARTENDRIVVTLSNRVTDKANKVESTKIGVKTCKKICEELDGTFRTVEEDKMYKTKITFPISHEK
ncbi:MAG: HAMP domain-containing protein [Anaerovoracaceae bacterium]